MTVAARARVLQLGLDFEARARSSDPVTSHLAAAKVIEFGHAHQAVLLGWLLTAGAATIYELADRSGLTHVQVARRLPELEALGAARPSGATRIGPTGRQCRVWEAC